MARYYGITLVVLVSVHPYVCCTSVFSFPDDNLNVNGFPTNLVYTLILWRPCFGLQMGKIQVFDLVICPQHANGVLSFHVFIMKKDKMYLLVSA